MKVEGINSVFQCQTAMYVLMYSVSDWCIYTTYIVFKRRVFPLLVDGNVEVKIGIIINGSILRAAVKSTRDLK